MMLPACVCRLPRSAAARASRGRRRAPLERLRPGSISLVLLLHPAPRSWHAKQTFDSNDISLPFVITTNQPLETRSRESAARSTRSNCGAAHLFLTPQLTSARHPRKRATQQVEYLVYHPVLHSRFRGLAPEHTSSKESCHGFHQGHVARACSRGSSARLPAACGSRRPGCCERVLDARIQ